MGTSRRHALRRRYLSLALGELAAAGVFLTLALALVVPKLDEESRPAMWFALAPLLVVLVQAGIYWMLARSWVDNRSMPPPISSIYRTVRVLDVALLVGGLCGLIVFLPDGVETRFAFVAIWLFGVVEYVNYFVIRLAYPPHLWLSRVGQLRTPRLIHDLNEGS